MPINIQCQNCGGKFRAPDKAAGKRAKCPKCSAEIIVPSPEQVNLMPVVIERMTTALPRQSLKTEPSESVQDRQSPPYQSLATCPYCNARVFFARGITCPKCGKGRTQKEDKEESSLQESAARRLPSSKTKPSVQATTFAVRIMNEPLSGGEKIARMGNIESTSLLRAASLSITHEEIELSCNDDLGRSHILGSIPRNDICRIKLKKSIITPGQQLIKPAMTGALAGALGIILLWLKVGKHSVIGIPASIAISIAFVIFVAGIFVVVNLGKIAWSYLAVVVFEFGHGKSADIAIEDEKVDTLLALFADCNIPVEGL